MAFVNNLQILQNNFRILSTSVKFQLGIDVRTHELASTVSGLHYIPEKNSYREDITFVEIEGATTKNTVVSVVTANGHCTITSAKNLEQARTAGRHVVAVLTNNGYKPTVEIDQVTEYMTYGEINIVLEPELISRLDPRFELKNNKAVAFIAGVTIKIYADRIGLTGPSTVLLWNSLNVIKSLPGIHAPQ